MKRPSDMFDNLPLERQAQMNALPNIINSATSLLPADEATLIIAYVLGAFTTANKVGAERIAAAIIAGGEAITEYVNMLNGIETSKPEPKDMS